MKADSREADQGALPAFRACVLTFLIVSALVFPMVLGLGMTQGLSRDEHQHVAAGALVAREGLLPYRDFPHFHTPYLPYAYALLFRFSDHLLNSARLLSILCATGILGVIGSVGWHLFRARGRAFAAKVCAGSVLLAMMTHLFTATSGHAWNHEPALFLTLIAVMAHIAGLRSGRIGWFVASGALLGLAIGTRLTCAPLVAPFGLALLLYSPPLRWQWGRVLTFAAGLLTGLAGVLFLFAVVSEQAFFANFGFAKANIVYRFSTGEPRTMTIAKKLRFFFKLIIRPDAALFVAGLLPVLAAFLARRGTARRSHMQMRFILLLLPFVLIGCFAPSPLFDQYFYPLVPFLLLAGLYAWASIPAGTVWFRRTLLTGLGAVALALVMGVRSYRDILEYFNPGEWCGTKLHLRAQKMLSQVPRGRILTLAPIHPLEAGLQIYPAFSTGPFAWRISPYIAPAKAARLGILSPTTLAAALDADPPAGVLVGFAKKGEELLSAYASDHGYRSWNWTKRNQLWLAPRD